MAIGRSTRPDRGGRASEARRRRCPVAFALPVAAALSGPACAPAGGGPRPLTAADPLLEDTDRRPFIGPPASYETSQLSDGLDKTVLRPLPEWLRFDVPGREAININTLDEVPDSSWFENRHAVGRLPPARWVAGPCQGEAPVGPWTVVSGKGAGAAPGFVAQAADGRKGLIKFDNPSQGPRASAADVIVSRMFHAVGYFVPCNRVLKLSPSDFRVSPEATKKDRFGVKQPLTEREVAESLAQVPRQGDGSIRALLSEWLPGRPLGAFRFERTREGDLNDIVPHEHRRELRGLRLLAAWVAHKDQREENTFVSWIEVAPGLGWVKHAFIDFGDCFGHYTGPSNLARRLAGHAHAVDLGQILGDVLGLGMITRPFERERFGPTQEIFAYYNALHFDPEAWKAVYPNPAFDHMTERDGAWMARKLARFREPELRALIREGLDGYPEYAAELLRVMVARRELILRRYLTRLSALHAPVLRGAAERPELCLEDLAVFSGIAPAQARTARLLGGGEKSRPLAVSLTDAQVCVALPASRRRADRLTDLLLEPLRAGATGSAAVELLERADEPLGYRVAGLRRW